VLANELGGGEGKGKGKEVVLRVDVGKVAEKVVKNVCPPSSPWVWQGR